MSTVLTDSIRNQSIGVNETLGEAEGSNESDLFLRGICGGRFGENGQGLEVLDRPDTGKDKVRGLSTF